MGRCLQRGGMEGGRLARLALPHARPWVMACGAILGARLYRLLAMEAHRQRQDGQSEAKGLPGSLHFPDGPGASWRILSSSSGCSSSISRSANLPVHQDMFIGYTSGLKTTK